MMRLGFLRRQTELLHLCACTQPRCRHSLVVPHLLCTPTHTSKSTETVVLIVSRLIPISCVPLFPCAFVLPWTLAAPAVPRHEPPPALLRRTCCAVLSVEAERAAQQCACRAHEAAAFVVLYCNTSQPAVLYCNTVYCVATRCTATPCTVLQHVVLCSGTVLQHVVVCCALVHRLAARCALRCAAWAAWRTRWLRSSSA
jgi:hypothetical protein